MRDASLRRDDPVVHRVVNKLGQRMESKLEHDVSPVCLSGLHRSITV